MPHVRDISGAYCPMGCGETLHLMSGGLIQCLARNCPDQGAAQKILSDRETDHVVLFEEDLFTVRHPLRERLDGDLFSCEVHGMCWRMDGPPGGIAGRYRARVTPGGLALEALADEGDSRATRPGGAKASAPGDPGVA
jgi:Family of unknown function (DUF6085)